MRRRDITNAVKASTFRIACTVTWALLDTLRCRFIRIECTVAVTRTSAAILVLTTLILGFSNIANEGLSAIKLNGPITNWTERILK